jgi:hypothetical protein
MASTTLMPIDPALSPQRVSRVLTISADLLPDEIVAGRRARRTRAWVLVVLMLVLAGLGGWYALAERDLRAAGDELTAVTDEAADLQRRQNDFAPVVNVQAETTTITKQLGTLLANDLPWATLTDTLRRTGSESGVTVGGMSGTLDDAEAGASGAVSLPSTSGTTTIGTVTVTGTAPDKPSVAKYVDALSGLTIVANPYLTSVAETDDDVQFSLTVDITANALCGRFTTACKTGGN